MEEMEKFFFCRNTFAMFGFSLISDDKGRSLRRMDGLLRYGRTGRWFESNLCVNRSVAQLVERSLHLSKGFLPQ